MSSLKVINDRCITCGACASIDPEHFALDSESGISKVISEENITDNTKVAVDACPVAAIELKEGIQEKDNIVAFLTHEEAEKEAA